MVGASHEWEFKTEKIFLYTRFCLVGHVFTLALEHAGMVVVMLEL